MSPDPEAGAAAAAADRGDGRRESDQRFADRRELIRLVLEEARRIGASQVQVAPDVIIWLQPAQQPPRSAAADNWRRVDPAPPPSPVRAPKRRRRRTPSDRRRSNPVSYTHLTLPTKA